MAEDSLIATKGREHSALSDYLREPLNRLRGEVDRMFDEFPPRFPASNLGIRYLASLPLPALEMKESDEAYRLSVELPGVSHEDVDLSIEGDMLILKGEKKAQRDEQERDYTISERSYGAFERRISLPKDSDADGIEASSDNGVISIVIPRSKEMQKGARKIEVSTRAST